MAERINTGSPYPFFAIIHPNIVNPYDNNMGLGCSVFSQAVDNLKGVDIAYNNFNRDLWLGGKKVFYSRELTKTIGVDNDGKPIYLAPDDMLQQLFVSVGDEITEDKKLVHEFNPDLRVQDNRDAVQAQLDYLSFKCGMGTRHYQFSNNMRAAQVTATQYTGEKQELKQNAAKHGIVVEQALQSIVRAILGGYLPYIILFILSGAITELLLWKIGYGSAKALTIGYIINQVLAAFGSTIIPYAIAASAMADQAVTDGRQDTILDASKLLQSWVSVALVIGVIVAALIGALIGKRIVKKHLTV